MLLNFIIGLSYISYRSFLIHYKYILSLYNFEIQEIIHKFRCFLILLLLVHLPKIKNIFYIKKRTRALSVSEAFFLYYHKFITKWFMQITKYFLCINRKVWKLIKQIALFNILTLKLTNFLQKLRIIEIIVSFFFFYFVSIYQLKL